MARGRGVSTDYRPRPGGGGLPPRDCFAEFKRSFSDHRSFKPGLGGSLPRGSLRDSLTMVPWAMECNAVGVKAEMALVLSKPNCRSDKLKLRVWSGSLMSSSDPSYPSSPRPTHQHVPISRPNLFALGLFNQESSSFFARNRRENARIFSWWVQ